MTFLFLNPFPKVVASRALHRLFTFYRLFWTAFTWDLVVSFIA